MTCESVYNLEEEVYYFMVKTFRDFKVPVLSMKAKRQLLKLKKEKFSRMNIEQNIIAEQLFQIRKLKKIRKKGIFMTRYANYKLIKN